MRGAISSSLSLLLSLLMFSNVVSASACDLECWLGQANSDCHDGGSATAREADMSMSPSMVMHVNRDETGRTDGTPGRTITDPEDSMAMPADMDMGPDGDDSAFGTDAGINATPSTLMFMSKQLDIMTELLVREQKPVMEESAMPDHSRTVSSCTHETCSQISVSTSPPKAQHSDHDALCSVASSASSLLNIRTDFHWIRPGTPPLENATVDHLAAILRV
jgi:hypothetical protein